MKRKFGFVFAVFAATVLVMALQKPVFLAWYAAGAPGTGIGDWLAVLPHGLALDLTVAGYVAGLPLLVPLASL